MRRVLCSPAALLVCGAMLLAATPAAAEDPWSPLSPDPTAQITDGVFTNSPLKLPFEQVSVRGTPPDADRPGEDFEHTLAAPYDEVIAYFEDEGRQKKGFAIVDPTVFPEGAGKKFTIVGSRPMGSGVTMRFTHPNVSRDLSVQIRPKGEQTVVVFENIVYTRLSSGVMPARAGFESATLDEELSFNWN